MAGSRKRKAAVPETEAGPDQSGPKRRSSRQAAAQAAAAAAAPTANAATSAPAPTTKAAPRAVSSGHQRSGDAPPLPSAAKSAKPKQTSKPGRGAGRGRPVKPEHSNGPAVASKGSPEDTGPARGQPPSKPTQQSHGSGPGDDSIPATNPEAPRHDGEWYWLMKAEPETRLENGVDVSFSIDDLRAKTKPEGWDGIRAYAARNHMRSMNVGDKAFFYHSNCKEPGIVGIMEIVKEFSPDDSALVPAAPYYDAAYTKENARWSLVHVEFRRKFAMPISLRELRELGKPGGVLDGMQMLKQSRLSVSRVSSAEWTALCRLADDKAADAGLEHEG